LATSALFSQSISANFQTDMEGWTSHQTTVEWANLFAPMNDRGGISFARENADENDAFLFIQKELLELLPNARYRITFNTSWLAWLETTAFPISVHVGAMNEFPTETIEITLDYEIKVLDDDGETVLKTVHPVENRTKIRFNNENFVVAGQLTPNENGLAFTQNINNFDNAFYVNTNDEGRLFLMIGIETENPKIENVFLNTLRIVLREVPKTQEVQEDEKIEEDEEKTEENKVEEDSKEMSSRT